jgi:hypothetical protein
LLEFDIKVRVSKYDEITKHKNPDFNYSDALAEDIKEHLSFSIMHSPYIVHSASEVLVYNIVDIIKVE